MTTTTAPFRLWRSPRYLTWLAGDTGKGLAATLASFAIPLLALTITGDPAQAGIIGAIGMALRVVTTLAGGVLADRHRRLVLMAIGGAIGVVLSAAFALLSATDALTFGGLLVVSALLAVRGGLFDVAGESALKEVVPDEAIGRAQAANQGRDAVLNLVGGPLGGALLAIGGWAVGVAMTAAHLAAAGAAFVLSLGESAQRRGVRAAAREESNGPDSGGDAAHERGQDAAAPASIPPRNAASELREAFAWLFARADLRGVVVISTIINLGFNAALTTVIYGLQQQGSSPVAIGWVSTGGGAAMLLGALVAPMLVARVSAGVLVVAGLAAAAAGAAGLSLVQAPVAVAAVLAASVLLLPALNAALLGYFMVAVPGPLLGRANSVISVLGMGAMPLAPLIAGFGLAWVGRTTTVLVCAALCVVALALAVGNRALRALPVESGWVAHAAQFPVR